MWNRILLIGLLTVGGCAAIPPSEYQEENLGTIVLEEEESETVLVPETSWDDFRGSEGDLPQDIVAPVCECHLQASESRGLICFGLICSEDCPEHTRDCAELVGGCTTR